MATDPDGAWFDAESSGSEGSFCEADLAAALSSRRVRGAARQCDGASSTAHSLTRKARRTRGVAERKATARSNAEDGGLPRVPRPLLLLRTLNWADQFVPREQQRAGMPITRVDSKANAEVLMAEQCEALPQAARFMVSGGRHPRTGATACSNLFELSAVCIHPLCSFHAKWKRVDGLARGRQRLGRGRHQKRTGVLVIEEEDEDHDEDGDEADVCDRSCRWARTCRRLKRRNNRKKTPATAPAAGRRLPRSTLQWPCAPRRRASRAPCASKNAPRTTRRRVGARRRERRERGGC
jgi:hypothetical protein